MDESGIVGFFTLKNPTESLNKLRFRHHRSIQSDGILEVPGRIIRMIFGLTE